MCGHFGIDRCLALLSNRFYWPRMRSEVEYWVKSCQDCATKENPPRKARAPQVSIPVDASWTRVGVDVTRPYPRTSNGSKYIIVFIDHFSKWVECACVPETTAPTVARVFMELIISCFGAPAILQSERGSNFLSELVSEVNRLFNVKHLKNTSYNPRCNGQCEKQNHSLIRSLAKYTSSKQDQWHLYVPMICMAYRFCPATESTHYSPYYLLFGKHPRLLIDVSPCRPKTLSKPVVEHLDCIVDRLRVAQAIADENIKAAQSRNKKQYDRTARVPTYELGDYVYLHTPQKFKGRSPNSNISGRGHL